MKFVCPAKSYEKIDLWITVICRENDESTKVVVDTLVLPWKSLSQDFLN